MTAGMLCIGMTACSDSDDGEGNAGVANLVSEEIPSKVGWNGDFNNGIVTFRPDEEIYDDEPFSYLAFSFVEGKCTGGAVNVVFPDEQTAQKFENMLRSGDWTDEEDDEDEAEYNNHNRIARLLLSQAASRSSYLAIDVSRKGKVIYMACPNIQGVSIDDVKAAAEYWAAGSYGIDLPDHVVFGKYENGIYTCGNLMGLGIDYRIETSFNAGICTKFVTIVKCPNKALAEGMYELVMDEMGPNSELATLMGGAPEITINDATVSVNALISGEPTQESIETTIIALDISNNCPALWLLMK